MSRIMFFLGILLLAAIMPCLLYGQTISAASASYRAAVIRESHAQGGLTAPVPIFAAQLMQESGFKPTVHSSVGAQGIAQFMPNTVLWLSKVEPKDWPQTGALDPEWSIRSLVFYDYWLHKRCSMYPEDPSQNRWAAALAAYNGGLGWVQRDSKVTDSGDWWNVVSFYNDGRTAANLKQNRNYPQRILLYWEPAFIKAGWQ